MPSATAGVAATPSAPGAKARRHDAPLNDSRGLISASLEEATMPCHSCYKKKLRCLVKDGSRTCVNCQGGSAHCNANGNGESRVPADSLTTSFV